MLDGLEPPMFCMPVMAGKRNAAGVLMHPRSSTTVRSTPTWCLSVAAVHTSTETMP